MGEDNRWQILCCYIVLLKHPVYISLQSKHNYKCEYMTHHILIPDIQQFSGSFSCSHQVSIHQFYKCLSCLLQTYWVVNAWNNLQQHLVEAHSLNEFKTKAGLTTCTVIFWYRGFLPFVKMIFLWIKLEPLKAVFVTFGSP